MPSLQTRIMDQDLQFGVYYPLNGQTVWCGDQDKAMLRLGTAMSVRALPSACFDVVAAAAATVSGGLAF